MRAIARCSSRHLADQPLMADGARRSRARMRGRRRGGDAAVPLLRSCGVRPAGGGARAHADAGDQILDLQDRAGADLRSDGVPRRQRLRRGGVLARLYREAPVNAIWEGSGNVVCLDLLRALARDGEAARAVLAEIARATAGLCRAARKRRRLWQSILTGGEAEAHARARGRTAGVACAVEALQVSAPAIAEIFAEARLAERSGRTYGAATSRTRSCQRLLERALPDWR